MEKTEPKLVLKCDRAEQGRNCIQERRDDMDTTTEVGKLE